MEPAHVGQAFLWGATVFALAAAILPWSGARRRLRSAAILATVATLILAYALLTNDFALDYVARTTSRATPWPYRLAALWGGMEGSMLFYTTMLLAVGAWGVRRAGELEQRLVAGTGAGLLLLTAWATNPFTRLDIPAVDGQGLLAILQHPAMVYHPPILYLGLTTLVVPFALAVGHRARGGDLEPGIPELRRALLVPWTLLTLGMVAGANWAYVELGWGGYWAWDPVENTALMPWLAATVFFHTSRVTSRDGRLRRWTTFFAAFPFALSVLGVYLTRSGVTGSIHSFAENPFVGRILLVAALGAATGVVWMAVRTRRGPQWGDPGTARDTWLVVSGTLVGVALLFVLVGSAYPAYIQVFTGDTVVLGTRYFVTTVLPVGLLVALLTGFALQTTWGRHGVTPADVSVFVVGGLLGVGLLAVVAQALQPAGAALAILASGAIAVTIRQFVRRRRIWDPARLAHLGLAMVLVGAGGSSLGTETAARMQVGETIEVGSHLIELMAVTTGEADRYVYAEGVFLVDGSVELRPQIRGYEDQARPVAEPALWSTPLADVILAVSLLTPDVAGFEVAVFVRPMVWWVWAGAVVLTLVGAASLAATAGAGAVRRRPATTTPPPAGTTTGTNAG